MTARIPAAYINGRLQTLPSGDTIDPLVLPSSSNSSPITTVLLTNQTCAGTGLNITFTSSVIAQYMFDITGSYLPYLSSPLNDNLIFDLSTSTGSIDCPILINTPNGSQQAATVISMRGLTYTGANLSDSSYHYFNIKGIFNSYNAGCSLILKLSLRLGSNPLHVPTLAMVLTKLTG